MSMSQTILGRESQVWEIFVPIVDWRRFASFQHGLGSYRRSNRGAPRERVLVTSFESDFFALGTLIQQEPRRPHVGQCHSSVSVG